MMKYKEKEIYYLDDIGLKDYFFSSEGRLNTSDLIEHKDYCLESINILDEGINISIKVENLVESDSYFINGWVA